MVDGRRGEGRVHQAYQGVESPVNAADWWAWGGREGGAYPLKLIWIYYCVRWAMAGVRGEGWGDERYKQEGVLNVLDR